MIAPPTTSIKSWQLWSIIAGLAGLFTMVATQQWFLLLLAPAVIGFLLLLFLYTEKTLLFAGALAPLSINYDDLPGGFGLTIPTEPIYMILFVALIFWWLRNPILNKRILLHPLSIIMAAYLAWYWLCIPFSSMPLVSFKFVLARTWYIIIFYFAVLHIFRDYYKIHWFYKAFTITTLALVIYTLIKHSADGFLRSSSYSVSWPFFPDHGQYAAAIAFAVPILLIYALAGRHFKIPVTVLPALLILLGILLFGIVVSYTRATWLSLLAATAVYGLIKFKIKFTWVLIALVAALSYGIYDQDNILYGLEANKQGSADDIEGHVKSVSNITTDPSNLERINRWKCAARMVQEKPLFGFGPGTYVFQYGSFQKSDELTLISTFSGDLGDAHSEYFSAMSEAGFIGLLLFTAIVLGTLGYALRVIYIHPVGKIRYTAMIAILGLATYYFHAFLNNYSQYDKIAVPLWVFTAVIAALDIYGKDALASPTFATDANGFTKQ